MPAALGKTALERLYSTPVYVLAATSVLTCMRKSKCAHHLTANNVEKENASTLREKFCLHTEVNYGIQI